MSLQKPKYPVSELYLFAYFPTREDYERATGKPCPPWNPNQRPKHWFDPGAPADDYVIYERVLATNLSVGGQPLANAEGKPYLKKLVLPTAIAVAVNIPPAPNSGQDRTNAEVPEYPVPLRALTSDEELFWDPNAPGTVAVKNIPLWEEQIENAAGFTARDRKLLQAIAKKLGL